MLRGWPTEELFWWNIFPDCDAPLADERRLAAHYYASIPRKLYPHIRFARSKAALLDKAWVGYAVRHFVKTLETVKPDVIWVIPHQWSIPVLAAALPNLSLRYHVSVHDFSDIASIRRRVGRRIAKRWQVLTENLYQSSDSRDAISPEMAARLRAKTGKEADFISRAGVEPEEFDYLSRKNPRLGQTIRVAYAGTIIAERSLHLFVEGLQRCREKLPRPIELHFFGAHSYQDRVWFDPSFMVQHGNVPTEELTLRLRDCDWGFAPMEMTNANPEYNCFSLPAKVTTYLAAGLAVISIAHRDSTISRLLNSYDLGPAVDEFSSRNIDEQLNRAFNETKVWQRYGPEVIRCAKTEFDAASMRESLWSKLGVTGT
jgi:glycosyltransferase involved in cell wall biosynthesis